MLRSVAIRIGVLTLCASAPLVAQGAVIDGRLTAGPTPDTLFLGRWTLARANREWVLDMGPNHRYRLWRVDDRGDTLVASMGAWSVEHLPLGRDARRADHVCLRPVNRESLCGRILLDDLGYPEGYRWQFVERERASMSWVAYREGRAPWQRDAGGSAREPVLSMNEVTVRPRLFRCPDPPTFPDHEDVPERVTVELVVEIDSSASGIRVLDPVAAGVRRRVADALETCEFVPGTLNGRPVRVLVRMPVPLRRGH